MSIETDLHARSASQCELCKGVLGLEVFVVQPKAGDSSDECILLCETCRSQVNQPELLDPQHWRCLNDSMWSEIPAVQVMAWRTLQHLRAEGWPQDLLDMLYLEDSTLAWAQMGAPVESSGHDVTHVDAHGAALNAGDNVTLIKDLNVKGAGFTAKRGTAVRGISLVANNSAHIEGRVNGQQIVILCEFVKRMA